MMFSWLLRRRQTQEDRGAGPRSAGGGGPPSCAEPAGVLECQGQASSVCPEHSPHPWPESSSCDWRMWTDYLLKELAIN